MDPKAVKAFPVEIISFGGPKNFFQCRMGMMMRWRLKKRLFLASFST